MNIFSFTNSFLVSQKYDVRLSRCGGSSPSFLLLLVCTFKSSRLFSSRAVSWIDGSNVGTSMISLVKLDLIIKRLFESVVGTSTCSHDENVK